VEKNGYGMSAARTEEDSEAKPSSVGKIISAALKWFDIA
jgi:hypothetical protein